MVLVTTWPSWKSTVKGRGSLCIWNWVVSKLYKFWLILTREFPIPWQYEIALFAESLYRSNDCDAEKNVLALIRGLITLGHCAFRVCGLKICIDSRWVTITLHLLVVSSVGYSASVLRNGRLASEKPHYRSPFGNRNIFSVCRVSVRTEAWTICFWWLVAGRYESRGKLKLSLASRGKGGTYQQWL
jgi:hypothetical protein